MKRAKKPPPAELQHEASVYADILALAKDREITQEESHRVDQLVAIAMSEYMRRFKARKQNVWPFVVNHLSEGGAWYESDYQCFFCRKSINSLPSGRGPSAKFIKSVLVHANECGVRMLAGLMEPHKPLKEGEPGL